MYARLDAWHATCLTHTACITGSVCCPLPLLTPCDTRQSVPPRACFQLPGTVHGMPQWAVASGLADVQGTSCRAQPASDRMPLVYNHHNPHHTDVGKPTWCAQSAMKYTLNAHWELQSQASPNTHIITTLGPSLLQIQFPCAWIQDWVYTCIA